MTIFVEKSKFESLIGSTLGNLKIHFSQHCCWHLLREVRVKEPHLGRDGFAGGREELLLICAHDQVQALVGLVVDEATLFGVHPLLVL